MTLRSHLLKSALSLHLFLFCLLGASLIKAESATTSSASENDDSPIIAVESPYDYETTLQNLKKAIAGRNFRLIRIQQLTDGFTKDKQLSRDTIIYFCNFSLVNKAIKIDSRIGQFLPCRITVHESNGKVVLMAMNPKPFGELLGHKQLKTICSEMTDMYNSLLEDATI